jgi:3-phenylpropionate/trans-cinnamate dioxygenase ferredoxin reductase subunit
VLHLAVAEDAAELRDRMARAGRVVVIGGGFIGLEAAAMAAEAGADVSVLEATDRLMGRVVTEPVSRFFEQLHRAHGVKVELLSEVTAIEGDASGVKAVLTADGTTYPADVVVVGIGAVPRDELAAAAGVETDNGVAVGPTLQTSDPHVYAIGDCARFHTRFSHATATVRLESVQNAVDQAKLVAMQLHHPAAERAYDAVPWFWTVQFGHRLQIAGLTLGYDRAEQVGEEDGKFSIYSYRDEVFIGCESVNMPRDHVRARKELATHLTSAGHPEPRP